MRQIDIKTYNSLFFSRTYESHKFRNFLRFITRTTRFKCYLCYLTALVSSGLFICVGLIV